MNNLPVLALAESPASVETSGDQGGEARKGASVESNATRKTDFRGGQNLFDHLPAVPVLADSCGLEASTGKSSGRSGEARHSIQERNPNVAAAGNPTYEMRQTSNRNEVPNEAGQADAETLHGLGMQAMRKREETTSDQQSIRPKISSQMEGENSRPQRKNSETEQMRAVRDSNQIGGPSRGLHEAAVRDLALSLLSHKSALTLAAGKQFVHWLCKKGRAGSGVRVHFVSLPKLYLFGIGVKPY